MGHGRLRSSKETWGDRDGGSEGLSKRRGLGEKAVDTTVRSKSSSLGPHFLAGIIYIKMPSASCCENVVTGVKGSA